MKNSGAMHLYVQKLRIDKRTLWDIVRIGAPAGAQSMVSSASGVLIQSAINAFGPVIVAGTSAATNLGNFVHMAMSSFYQSAISFSSQNCGAKRYDRVWKLLGSAWI